MNLRTWYKQLYMRLGWPLRIVLLAVTAVAGLALAYIGIGVLLGTMMILAVFLPFLALGAGRNSRAASRWRKEEDEQWQYMHDAYQREQEDKG